MAQMRNKTTRQRTEESAKLRDNPPFALVESFRNLLTNISFAIPQKEDGSGRVICVSSAMAGEGKTTVSVNIALSCASMGAKTVLIDCDMRKPSVRRYFDIEGKGMVDYLSGQAELGEVLSSTAVSKLPLDIIAGRKTAPNPMLLLKGDRFENLLKKLAREYDYVIIDTPPLSIVSDALMIAKHTDGILLVARQMVSRYPAIGNVLSDIDFAGVQFLGFVLNDYKAKNSEDKYYKKYSYSYKQYGK